MLHVSQLAAFKKWLDANNVKHRPGKDEYQVMQVYYGGKWLAVCVNDRNCVVTLPMMHVLILMFNGNLEFKQPIDAPVVGVNEAVRDDLAKEVMKLLIQEMLDTVVEWDHEKRVAARRNIARTSYQIADEMLEAKKIVYTKQKV